MHRFGSLFICLGLFAGQAYSQTRVHLQTQGKTPDFSAMSKTKPMTTGTSLPVSCSSGEYFFKQDAPTGQNTYACVATNTWALQGDGGSVPGGIGLGDVLQVQRASMTRLTINPSCAPASPCDVRFGVNSFQFTSSATVTLSGSETGALRIYVKKDGTIYAGHNLTDGNVVCTGCIKVPGVTDFPNDSIPAYSWPVTSGSFDPAQGQFDKRAFLSTKTIAAGTGIITSSSSGESSVAINSAVVGTFASGTGNTPATCAVGQKYIKTSTNEAYECTSTNTWTETTRVGSLVTKLKITHYFPAVGSGTLSGYTGTNFASPDTNGAPFGNPEGVAPWRHGHLSFSDGLDTITTNLTDMLPASWDGGTIFVRLKWWSYTDPEATQVLRWLISTACVSDGDAFDPAGAGPVFNTAEVVETSVVSGGNNKQISSDVPSLTTTGCAPGDVLYVRIQRDANHANDTFTGTAQLYGAQVDYLVNLQ